MIKRVLGIFMVMVMAVALLAFPMFASAESFKTTEQVLNAAYSTTPKALKTVPAPLATTEFKKAALAPSVDSGTALALSSPTNSWTFTNLNDTCPVYINFDSAATLSVSLKVLAKTSVAFDSKITTIHAIASDTSEVQVLGAY